MEAAQQQRFQQMIDEHNQLFLYRPDRMESAYGATTMDAGLDALGTADPTGLVDGYHALTYVARGEWGNAGLTALGVFPILGDAFKLAKYGKYADEAVGAVEAGARWGDEVADLATSRVSTLDLMDGRPVSGHIGYLGSPRLTRAEQLAFREEMAEIGVNVERNADRFLDAVDSRPVAAFDFNEGTVYLRKDTTFYQMFHEGTHARQWSSVGREAYKDLGEFRRERHVFSEIRRNRELFTRPELQDATRYILQKRSAYRLGYID